MPIGGGALRAFRSRTMRKRYLGIGLLIALAVTVVAPAGAQSDDRSVVWRRWDVTIDNVNPRDNRYDVTESYDMAFEGTFRFGVRDIEKANLAGITDVSISQDGQALRANCSQQPGTYCVSDSGDT